MESQKPGYKPDAHSKFRNYLGAQKRLVDRRVLWSSPNREYVPSDKLSKGEQKARKVFWREIAKGASPMLAVAHALEIQLGPIPELQSHDDFALYWSPDKLTAIGTRWKASKHHPKDLRVRGKEAQNKILDDLPHLTEDLLALARDTMIPPAVRKAAIKDAMDRLPNGVWQDANKQSFIKIPDITAANAPELEKLLLTIPQQIKDAGVANMMCTQIKFLLAKCLPDKYGDRIDVNLNHTVDLRSAMKQGEARVTDFLARRQLAKNKDEGDLL